MLFMDKNFSIPSAFLAGTDEGFQQQLQPESMLEDYCQRQREQLSEDWAATLPPSSRAFLEQLDLPFIHPFCSDPLTSLVHPSAPPMGPSSFASTESILDTVVTWFYFYIPPLYAFVFLWSVILSAYLAPLGFIYLIGRCWFRQKQPSSQKEQEENKIPLALISCFTLAFSWLLMTDDQNVFAFGRYYGFILLTGTLLVISPEIKTLRQLFYLLCFFLVLNFVSPWALCDAEESTTTVDPGLYYNNNNADIKSFVERWYDELPKYTDVSTRWQLIGDTRTAFPYLLNRLPVQPDFHTVWLPTEDDEFVALDIAFPSTGHDPSRPLYLILHGLNGGSREGYVADMTATQIQKGSTVVVLVARGLMDTPIQGYTMFDGIRTIDAHKAATTLRQRVLAPDQTLAGVGYSMGAIVLNRYVSTYKEAVALDVSVSISGALYTVHQGEYQRSQRTWQRMIASFTKENFMDKKWGQRLHQKLGHQDYRRLMRAQSVVGVDTYAGALYNGYDNVTMFYKAMSSYSPYDPELNKRNRIAIPHLVLQALDDPISTWRSNGVSDQASPLHPENLAGRVQDNLVLLFTRNGGHVGWPMGWWPSSWDYMNFHVATKFVDAYMEAKDLP